MHATKIMSSVLIGMMYSALSAAYNGMYLPGYGNESVAMGGADVAVARDAFAANNNPAGMTQLSGRAMDIELVAWYIPSGGHTDSNGNYRTRQNNTFGLFGSGAYARRFENTPYAAGVAMVVQGGQGWTYSGINTPFGTQDDASAQFAIVKLSPAVAWQVNDRLSLGVSLGVNYFSADQELFPNTSVAGSTHATDFNGFRLKGASGIGLNTKWGLQYRLAKDVVIGVTYGTQTSVPMKDGSMRVNYTNSYPGLGVVRYDNAKLSGFHLPEEFAIGISFRPVPSLMVSLQEKWYNWSAAIDKLELTASEPRNASAPATVSITSPAEFSNQLVYEAGFAYDYDRETVLMGGINYGKNPMPNRNVTPLFAPIQSLHYMLGVRRNIDAEWRGSLAFEWYVPRSATYDNPVFGHGTEISSGLLTHVTVSRRW